MSNENVPPQAPYATFAAGCFWCVESEFRRLDGVLFTRAGYEGGLTKNPSYQDVCTGRTGHAEAVEIYYDPKIITYRALLMHFLELAHDPTDLNGQGVDRGTQYRSAIFYADEDQKEQAQKAIADVSAGGRWKKPIVTTLEPQGPFWPAEEYHQQYYEKYEGKQGVQHPNMLYKMQKWAKEGR
ncbi:MAG: peptide-methionine (S)-S-oxide reductase [Micavibrio aeruginosavorus]|uniref:Peptide methionine sulfoxide reductase MsrA n=1 Tax=Micavibrio aeruginosavorus TaxID=349221 RepID=A0A2W5N303_9BACT|nr:MAG: peptide-methionine (S)-S-oxide reductase [Micavibrio aeruginosavorus]